MPFEMPCLCESVVSVSGHTVPPSQVFAKMQQLSLRSNLKHGLFTKRLFNHVGAHQFVATFLAFPFNRYRPKGVFGKGVGNSKNASEMRQKKCVKNASKWVLFYWETNASKIPRRACELIIF